MNVVILIFIVILPNWKRHLKAVRQSYGLIIFFFNFCIYILNLKKIYTYEVFTYWDQKVIKKPDGEVRHCHHRTSSKSITLCFHCNCTSARFYWKWVKLKKKRHLISHPSRKNIFFKYKLDHRYPFQQKMNKKKEPDHKCQSNFITSTQKNTVKLRTLSFFKVGWKVLFKRRFWRYLFVSSCFR